MMASSATPFLTIGLLILSNIFMTFAWYGHLKFEDKPLYLVIMVSWGIALFEYCAQVPANRLGYGEFTGFQLKIIDIVFLDHFSTVFIDIEIYPNPALPD